MSELSFLDTNVLVYAYDSSDRRKQRIARELLRGAVEGDAVVSLQVLGEFAATLLHKASPGVPPEAVDEILLALDPIRAIAPDAAMIRRAVKVRQEYGAHFYDGLIVAAAERAGCARIWSEDFNAGPRYFGVKIENPFV